MFRNLTAQLGAGGIGGGSGGGDKNAQAMTPTLRGDIYTAIEQAKGWIASGAAGDGVSFKRVLETIQAHFKDTKVGLGALGRAEGEVAAVVGGVTNMVLEFSKWEGMAGGMAMRRWTDELVAAHAALAARGPDFTKKAEQVARGITTGVNAQTDVKLITQEFTAKIQIISCLKSLVSTVNGAGTDEARRAEATLSSRFI